MAIGLDDSNKNLLTPQPIAAPVLDKDRKIGNQKITPIGTPDVQPVNQLGGDDRQYLGGNPGFDERTGTSTVLSGLGTPKPVESTTSKDVSIAPISTPIKPYQTTTVVGNELFESKPPESADKVTPAPVYTAESYTAQPQTLESSSSGLATPYNPTAVTPNTTPISGGLAQPVTQTVNDNDLVANQLTNLLSSDSKYIQLARDSAARTANSRGLLNSTIAAGAGEEAAIKQALPIAQQDANTYFSANTNNVNWQNQFASNLQQGNIQDSLNANTHERNKEIESLRQLHEKGMLDTEGQQRLTELEREAEIQANRDANQFEFQKELDSLRYQHEQGMLDAEGEQRLIEMEKAAEIQTARDETLHGYNLETMDKQAMIDSLRDLALHNFDMEKLNDQQQHEVTQQATAFANQIELTQMQIDANYRSQYLDTSARLVEAWSAEVQAIYQNPNMTPEQQANAVNLATTRHQQMMDNNAELYAGVSNWQVSSDPFPSDDSAGDTGNTGGTTPTPPTIALPPVDPGNGGGGPGIEPDPTNPWGNIR